MLFFGWLLVVSSLMFTTPNINNIKVNYFTLNCGRCWFRMDKSYSFTERANSLTHKQRMKSATRSVFWLNFYSRIEWRWNSKRKIVKHLLIPQVICIETWVTSKNWRKYFHFCFCLDLQLASQSSEKVKLFIWNAIAAYLKLSIFLPHEFA